MAAFEFIAGPLRTDPHRVGRRLREPLAPLWSARRGEYRVLYRILEPSVLASFSSVVDEFADEPRLHVFRIGIRRF